MKAYQVRDSYEGTAIIKFHEHRASAQADGANELNADFTSVECRRAPEFDQYAEKGYVPMQAYMEAGWWYACSECGEQVSADDDEFDKAVIEERDIWCSMACKNARAEASKKQNERFEEFKATVVERYGDQQYEFRGAYPYITMTAEWQIPGCQYNVSARDNGKGIETFCATIDKEAASAWFASKPLHQTKG